MNRSSILTPLVLLLGGALGVQEAQKDALEDHVEQLETRVKAIESYLQAQAKASQQLSNVLAASREAGFTHGINPKSREILLQGLGEAAQSVRSTVPGAPAPPEPKDESRRGVRRGQ